MPIGKGLNGEFVIQCANHCETHAVEHRAGDTGTTMRASSRLTLLLSIEQGLSPTCSGTGQPVHTYLCEACGYTEIYHVAISEPKKFEELGGKKEKVP